MTGYYLLDNRQNYQQFSRTRRNGAKVSGVIDVHTWESAPDWVGPDTGLENAIPYLLDRWDPGSYHSANDSDSTRRLLPWWMEAWHDRHTNNHAIGVSIATQANKWAKAPREWRLNAIRRAAQEAARIADEVFLCRDLSKVARLGIDVPAVWLTQAQAHGRTPGFVRHGTSDPGRRSDPWPENAPEAALFLAHYRAARKTGRYASDTLEVEDMPLNADDKYWISQELAEEVGNLDQSLQAKLPGLVADAVANFQVKDEKFSFFSLARFGYHAAQGANVTAQAVATKVEAVAQADDVAEALAGPVVEALLAAGHGADKGVLKAALQEVLAEAFQPPAETAETTEKD